MAVNGFDKGIYSDNVIMSINASNGFHTLVSNMFSPSNNGKIIVPVLTAGAAHTGGTNTFSAIVDEFVEIDTKNSASKPTAIKFIDEESTTLSMLNLKAQQDGKSCVSEVDAKSLRGAIAAVPVANRLKLDALDSTASKEITLKVLTRLVEIFDTAAIPLEERLLVVSPRFKSDLIGMENTSGKNIFISADTMGTADGKKAIIGEILGFKVHMAFDFPQLNTTSGSAVEPATTNERFAMLAMDKYAYAVAMDDSVDVRQKENLTDEQTEILSRVKYGHKETIPAQLWSIRQVLK